MLIKKYGYPVESHKVVTSDHYVLTMHRIPHGKNEFLSENEIEQKKRPVVFLQHGLFASSFEWMMNLPEKLLGKIFTLVARIRCSLHQTKSFIKYQNFHK